MSESETHVPCSSTVPPDFTHLPFALTREDDPSAWTSIEMDSWYGTDEIVRRGAPDGDRLWIRFGVSWMPSTTGAITSHPTGAVGASASNNPNDIMSGPRPHNLED